MSRKKPVLSQHLPVETDFVPLTQPFRTSKSRGRSPADRSESLAWRRASELASSFWSSSPSRSTDDASGTALRERYSYQPRALLICYHSEIMPIFVSLSGLYAFLLRPSHECTSVSSGMTASSRAAFRNS